MLLYFLQVIIQILQYFVWKWSCRITDLPLLYFNICSTYKWSTTGKMQCNLRQQTEAKIIIYCNHLYEKAIQEIREKKTRAWCLISGFITSFIKTRHFFLLWHVFERPVKPITGFIFIFFNLNKNLALWHDNMSVHRKIFFGDFKTLWRLARSCIISEAYDARLVSRRINGKCRKLKE